MIVNSTQLGDLGDPLVWTPSSIRSLADQTRTELAAVARDVAAERARSGQGVINDLQLTAWKDFYTEVTRFLGGITFTSTLWGATVERLQNYRARIADWRGQFSEQGSKSSTPTARSTGGAPRTAGGIPTWAYYAGGATILAIVLRPYLTAATAFLPAPRT